MKPLVGNADEWVMSGQMVTRLEEDHCACQVRLRDDVFHTRVNSASIGDVCRSGRHPSVHIDINLS
jgi:hypothetical protein